MPERSQHHDWYALFVLSGEEDRVKERLLYRFESAIRVLVPKRRIRERRGGKWYYTIKPLFPGYVLINGHIGTEEYYQLKNIPGLIKLLKSEYEPLKIGEEELRIISQLVCSDEAIGFSDVLLENGKVAVVDGPLVSMEGYILSIDRRKGRAKVKLNFLGEERTVELGVNVLQPG